MFPWECWDIIFGIKPVLCKFLLSVSSELITSFSVPALPCKLPAVLRLVCTSLCWFALREVCSSLWPEPRAGYPWELSAPVPGLGVCSSWCSFVFWELALPSPKLCAWACGWCAVTSFPEVFPICHCGDLQQDLGPVYWKSSNSLTLLFLCFSILGLYTGFYRGFTKHVYSIP